MNSISAFVVFSSILALAAAETRSLVYGTCYDIKTSASIDYRQFASGQWFEISRFVNRFEGNSSCAEQAFTSERQGEFAIEFKLIFENGTAGDLKGDITYAVGDGETILNGTFPAQLETSAFDIVATDYQNYAITYACAQIVAGSTPIKDELLWVLGRNGTLTSEASGAVNDTLNIIDPTIAGNLTSVVQENCAIFY